MHELESFPEHAAVRHLLEAPLIAPRTAPYVSADDFDWEGLEREMETMPGGGRVLVSLARELWKAEKTIGLWEIPRRLDAANFRRVIEALSIARGPATWPFPAADEALDGEALAA